MTPAERAALERSDWRKFLNACATGIGIGPAEARIRATWAAQERQQGIRR